MDSAKYTKSINPATEEEFGTTLENSIEDLTAAVSDAKKAQAAWGKLHISERKRYLLKIRDYIAENADRISEVISKDTGKTRMDALSTEVLPSAMAINYYSKNAKCILKPKKIIPGNILLVNKSTKVERVPLGVVGIISPWNYPFSIPLHEIAMALIAGNAVILKVASNTLAVGKMIQECVDAAELPKGLFSHINLPGKIAGDAFIESGIHKLFFTGSVEVGKYLMKKASEKLMPVSLELGGNDAMIVCADADLERSVGGAIWAGLSNAGQSCAGVERIFVDEKIYAPFVEMLKSRVLKLKLGVDTDFNVDIGSMTTESQLNLVRLHVKDAIDKGAKVFAGNNKDGDNNVGLFHVPVIIENVNNEMLTMREETFGPVLAVDSFTNIEDAIAKANDSQFGLTASVWSQDRKKARQIAAKLESGTITINDHLMSHGLAEAPWGGFKQSGLGRTHSYLGLESMTQPRTVVDDFLSPIMKRNMWWHPHSKETYDGLKGALSFLYVKNWSKKMEGLFKLVPVFMKCFVKGKDNN